MRPSLLSDHGPIIHRISLRQHLRHHHLHRPNACNIAPQPSRHPADRPQSDHRADRAQVHRRPALDLREQARRRRRDPVHRPVRYRSERVAMDPDPRHHPQLRRHDPGVLDFGQRSQSRRGWGPGNGSTGARASGDHARNRAPKSESAIEGRPLESEPASGYGDAFDSDYRDRRQPAGGCGDAACAGATRERSECVGKRLGASDGCPTARGQGEATPRRCLIAGPRSAASVCPSNRSSDPACQSQCGRTSED